MSKYKTKGDYSLFDMTNYIDLNVNGQSLILTNIVEKLEDFDLITGKKRNWRELKLDSLKVATSMERNGKDKKAERMNNCNTSMSFKRIFKTKELKVHKSNFCGCRICPLCSKGWSMKVFNQVSRVMNELTRDNDYKFIFLTLTIKSVKGLELENTLNDLFKAIERFFKKTKVKKSVKGWFRALEITHDTNRKITTDMWYGNEKKHIKSRKEYYKKLGLSIGDYNPNFDMYHPHFHIILMVNKTYFTDTVQYISHKQWTSFWKDSLRVDYKPMLDVRKFKTDSKKDITKVVSETAKYTVKSNDIIVLNDEDLTDKTVETLDNALFMRRLVSFGGEFKKINKDLEKFKKGFKEHEEGLREDIDYAIEYFQWDIGYSDYTRIYPNEI